MISIRDYMKISPKGRAAGARWTTYQADTQEEAYRLHNEAIESGKIAKPVKIAGWIRERG